MAQITVDANGQNQIIIVPGANAELCDADIKAAAPAFASSRVLLTQLEIPLPTTLAALRAGRKAGLKTIFNSAPAPTEPLPEELYGLCDIVCPNETETALLTGMPTDTLEQCEAAARSILAKGTGAVVMTLGSRGCLLVEPGKPVLHVGVPNALKADRVVDTTGAGDGFLGALGHLMASGKSLADSLPGAVHVASISVQRRGAQTSYPLASELPAGLVSGGGFATGTPSTASTSPPRRPSAAPEVAEAEGGERAHRRSKLAAAAGYHAVDKMVESGMVLAVGTGSTVGYVLERLAERMASGALKDITAVCTSEKTAQELKRLGIPSQPPESVTDIDLAIGSADAVDKSLNVVKGGKGALLREKLVQASAKRCVVCIDESKLCDRIGTSYPIAVEITSMFAQRTVRRIGTLPSLGACDAMIRHGNAPAGLPGSTDHLMPFLTDNGNMIVDVFLKAPLVDVAAAAEELTRSVGVVEHGLFQARESTAVLIGRADGSVTSGSGLATIDLV